MKNFLRISALAVALLGAAGVAGAQPTATKTATLDARAVVGSDISVTSSGSFTFGTVYRSEGPVSVDPLTAAAGYFVINGTAGSNVVASFAAPLTLTSAASTGSLPITWNYATVNAATGVCTASFSSGGFVQLSGTAATSGAPGAAKVCVGGTVTPVAGTTKIATDYTGTVTITVDFP